MASVRLDQRVIRKHVRELWESMQNEGFYNRISYLAQLKLRIFGRAENLSEDDALRITEFVDEALVRLVVGNLQKGIHATNFDIAKFHQVKAIMEEIHREMEQGRGC